MTSSATCPSSRSAKTSVAPGRLHAGLWPRPLPAKSTPTFSEASSGPKSSPTTRSPSERRWQRAGIMERFASRARSIVQDGDIINFRFAT